MFADFLNYSSVFIALFFLFVLSFLLFPKKKNLPCLGPRFPFGSIIRVLTCKGNFGKFLEDVYNEIKKKNWKLAEIYFMTKPTYFVIDLKYIKNVLKQDFDYFQDRGMYYNEKSDPLNAHLFNVNGSKWKKLRQKISPTFTSAKIKALFETLAECSITLEKRMKQEISKGPVDIKKILSFYTTDVIGSCAFGLELNTFENENSPFRVYGPRLLTVNRLNFFYPLVVLIPFKSVTDFLSINLIPKYVSNFFMKLVKDIINYRKQNNWTRKDFFQLLVDLKNDEDIGGSLTNEEIAAQCFIFYMAGYETSSSTLTFALYELAKHEDIQNRAREEINLVLSKHEGKITYESMKDMKYLNQVIDETLRKYPVLPLLTRECVKDYKVPNEDVIIKKGSLVIISILGVHYDEEFYSNPTQFDPERFNGKNKDSRDSFTHIPFGEGPRKCIGLRFALLQIKVGLVFLLKKYKFKVSQKTQEPLKFKLGFFLSVDGEVWLDVENLENFS